jgi:putative addiction module killer protein
VIVLKQTKVFTVWLKGLRDKRARARIDIRLERATDGNFGAMRSVGGTVSELKIDYGPGYRVYLTRRGDEIVVLLCGGDKSSQSKDIERAKKMAGEWKEDDDGS